MANPIGTITLWSGSVGTIPEDWQICDGTNGTPDLRDRFVQGAGGALAVDATGGAAEHNHDFTSNDHDHASGADVSVAANPAGVEVWDDNERSGAETVDGTTDNANGVPPFYALAYIMRME